MSWSGLPARLEQKIIPEPNSGCWLWIGSCCGTGYGSIRWEHGIRQAHRVVYKLLKGDVPNNIVLDHFYCENRKCVNPDPLCPTTHQKNILRGKTTIAHKFANRTHCKNGHPLTADNVIREKRSRARVCKICKKQVIKKWILQHREKCVQYQINYRNRNKDKINAYRRRHDAEKRRMHHG